MRAAERMLWSLSAIGVVVAASCSVDDRELELGTVGGSLTAGRAGSLLGGGADGGGERTGGVGGGAGAGGQAGAMQDAGAPSHAGGGQVDFSSISLAEAHDLNPEPNIVELNLEAAPLKRDLAGKDAEFWAYNGTVPGPLIRAKRGDHVIVHFVNHLPEDTMIHWHGVRVPNGMDGTPLVQPPVTPAQSFTYEFDVPDSGLYWYHPHLDISLQVMRGLYGPLLVEEPSERTSLPARDLVLVLSDTYLAESGELSFDSSDPTSLLNGREGNVLLVNGRVSPRVDIAAGEALRLRVVNAAGARYFQLRFPGQTWKKIGADGGLSTAAAEAHDVLISDGERAELFVVPRGEVGDELTLEQVPYYRGAPLTSDAPVPLLTLRVVARAQQAAPSLPASLRTIEPLSAQGATPINIDITLQGTTFKLNGVAGTEAPHLMGHVGEVQHWTVANESALDHPLHVHGYFFQVVDPSSGAPVSPGEWRDTVNIPRNGQLELLIHYDRPGMWMWHCHILDHPELGFMQMLDITP